MARQQVFVRQKAATVNGAATLGQPAQLDEIFRVPEELISSFPHSKRVGNYLIGKGLGEGAFAKVKLGLHVTSGMLVAIKIISKEMIKHDAYMSKHYRREPKLLQLFVHPNIVQLYEVLETDHSLYMILELCDGGDVVQLLKRGSKPLSEIDARKLMRQLLSAVEYIHRVGVLHRDLKAENFLLSSDSNLKITDFGLSTTFRRQVTAFSPEGQSTYRFKEILHQTQCGSPAYASPEVLSQQAYCQPADVWSLGVNMFYMLHSKLPFMVEPFSMHALLKKVRNYDIEPIRFDLSHACRDLLRRLLCLNESERITINEAMNHPWIIHNQETGEIERLESYSVTRAAIVQSINRAVLRYVCTKTQRAKTMSPMEVIQVISSNTPHELNALYHLLLKKLSDYCEANGITMEEYEQRDDAKSSQPASGNRSATDASHRNGMDGQQQWTQFNRPLRRPQTNKQSLSKASQQQILSRPQMAVQPGASAAQSAWKPQTTDDGDHNGSQTNRDYITVSSSDQVRSNSNSLASNDGPIYVNLNRLLSANGPSVQNGTTRAAATFNMPASSNSLLPLRSPVPSRNNGVRNHVIGIHPHGIKPRTPSAPSLRDMHERSLSMPATPTLLRRAGMSAREDDYYKRGRRVSTASSVSTKPELSRQYYQRMSQSSNRVDTLGLSKPRSATVASPAASQNRLSVTANTQPRTLHFASRLTKDFNI